MDSRRQIKALLAVVFLHAAYAARAAPELQVQEQMEQCRKLVDKQFKERRATGGIDDGNMRSRIESHYNVKRSKCFFLEAVIGVVGEKASPIEIQALWDANENKQYGWFKEFDSPGAVQSECFVQKTACHGKEEWERLIKPFMQE